MIEYNDGKMGKIKVLSVTEARANFATVIADSEAQYVITRNNKPLRVIIGYKDYEQLKNAVDTPQTGRSRPQAFTETAVDERIETAIHTKTPKKENSAGEGLFSSPSQQPATRLGEKSALYKKNKREEVVTVRDKGAGVDTGSVLRDDADYFSSYDEGTAEEILAAPEEGESKFNQNKSPAQEKPEKPEAKPAAGKKSAAKNLEEKLEGATAQELEYFKKYRKLYESSLPSEQAPTGSAGESRFPPRQKSSPAGQSASATKIDEPSPHDILQSEQRDEYQEQSEVKGGDDQDLPSLKDLLKDLEQERLSDEEEELLNLDDREIDDLIERITQD